MPDPRLSGILGQPFAEQVAAWRLRLGELRPTATWTDVAPEFHDRGFMVAGATKAELLADLAAAVDKAVAGGGTLEDFRRDFRATVARHGWHGWTGEGTVKGEAWRTRVIYKTNMATTYAAGRRAQLLEGGFKWWVYRHGGSKEPRIQHLGWDGLALSPDHPFWARHSPPNGWGCSCYVVGARTEAGIRRVGGDPGKTLPPGWDAIDPKTGVPKGIDKGWAYAPGETVADAVRAMAARLPALPAPIGSTMYHQAPGRAASEIEKDFAGFVDRALSSRVERNFMVVGALKPAWVAAAESAGISVATAEIAVQDLNVQHTFRGTPYVTNVSTKSVTRLPKEGVLDLDWYKKLPRHLLEPEAVLIDTSQKEPVFLLIYDVPGAKAKIVIELNTPIKKAGTKMNTLSTGRLVSLNDLMATVGKGAKLIEGKIVRPGRN